MRAQLEKLPFHESGRSFLSYEVKVPYFDFFWHFHPEYELTLVTGGKGKRLVGDSMEAFSAGDMVLLGPMLPHVWVSEEQPGSLCSAIVIQFPQVLVNRLYAFPECETLRDILNPASHGWHMQATGTGNLLERFERIPGLEGAAAIAAFIELFALLTKLPGRELASAGYKSLKSATNSKRINKILIYVEQHYKDEIKLGDAAKTVHLSESAFSKYFKRTLGKTFFDYVNEVRISRACSLLRETDLSIREIALASGFENLSYFNRVFLKKKNTTPHKFRHIGSRAVSFS
jgi:AraC-like DNA-binding protein